MALIGPKVWSIQEFVHQIPWVAINVQLGFIVVALESSTLASRMMEFMMMLTFNMRSAPLRTLEKLY